MKYPPQSIDPASVFCIRHECESHIPEQREQPVEPPGIFPLEAHRLAAHRHSQRMLLFALILIEKRGRG